MCACVRVWHTCVGGAVVAGLTRRITFLLWRVQALGDKVLGLALMAFSAVLFVYYTAWTVVTVRWW